MRGRESAMGLGVRTAALKRSIPGSDQAAAKKRPSGVRGVMVPKPTVVMSVPTKNVAESSDQSEWYSLHRKRAAVESVPPYSLHSGTAQIPELASVPTAEESRPLASSSK